MRRCTASRSVSTRGLAALLAMVFAVLVGPARATPEDPDAGYGVGGVVSISPPEMTRLRMAMLPDGSAVVAVAHGDQGSTQPGGLWRFDASGRPDATFGDRGFVAASRLCSRATCSVMDVGADPDFVHALLDDGRVVRLDASGAIDPRFGEAGYAAPAFFTTVGVGWLAADAAGRLLVSARHIDVPAPVVFRLRADGALDATYGAQPGRPGVVVFPQREFLARLVERDGSLVAALAGDADDRIVRLRPDGTVDPAFGPIVLATAVPRFSVATLLRDGAGRLLAGGREILDQSRSRPAVMALTAEGAADATFGDAGIVRIATDVGVSGGSIAAMALDGEGRVVLAGMVAGTRHPSFSFTPTHLILARLRPDGRMDTTFAPAGQARVRLAYGTTVTAAAVAPGGRIVMASGILEGGRPFGVVVVGRYRSALLAFKGGSTSYERPYAEDAVVEYVDRESGHFFVSSNPGETRLLDTDAAWSQRWTRTGYAFNVWTAPHSDRLPVCRFWSGSSFAPKSSHFYTPYAGECSALQHGSVWSYEGDVFALKLPDATTRACPVGARPLYRLYNDGVGGAPNHRYTVDPTVVDEMLVRGWTLEGDARTRVFACAPRHD